MSEDYTPVRVHIASSDVGQPAHRKRCVTRAKTIVLTAAEPAREIAPSDLDRVELWIIGDGTSAFLVGPAIGSVQGYADTTFAAPPEDTLMIGRKPAAEINPVPYHTTEAVFAASPAANGATTVFVRVIMVSEV